MVDYETTEPLDALNMGTGEITVIPAGTIFRIARRWEEAIDGVTPDGWVIPHISPRQYRRMS